MKNKISLGTYKKAKTVATGFIKKKERNYLITSIPVLSLNYFVTQINYFGKQQTIIFLEK